LAVLPSPRSSPAATWPRADAAPVALAAADAGPGPSAADGLVWLPKESSAIHTHGGDAAHLSKARFVARNNARQPVCFRVTSAEFLTSNVCDVPPQQPGRAIAPKSLGPNENAKDPLVATVAPGAAVEFTVVFAPEVDAYYTHCNRFGVRLRGVAGGKALEVMSETRVQREDP
jgi:hypothetical protein